jgi:hypothetical protein
VSATKTRRRVLNAKRKLNQNGRETENKMLPPQNSMATQMKTDWIFILIKKWVLDFV